MRTIMRSMLKLTAALLLVAALFGSGLSPMRTVAAACSPTISFDLWAKPGLATLYGSTTVPIWGYAATSSGPAGLPGPMLDVPLGTCVGVTLHNNLSENTSLLFQGQEMIPDLSGVAPGGTGLYTFTASRPGTFLYEAGLIPGAQHQVAMGLYGALIVRSATPGQAYSGASSAFDAENILVLSEFDTSLATSPAGFDMRKYAPKYLLINGKAYPGTSDISATAGNKVLLRYINAGLQAHAMSLLGFTQTVIATDGSPFTYPHKMASETIAPGQTLDTLITAPTNYDEGSRFALYDANMLLRNNNGVGPYAGLGGMLAFLSVTGGSSSTGPDTAGPLLTSLSLSPNPNDGTVPVALSFNANDSMTGNNNVVAAEYWIDGNATHTPITVGSPAPVVTLNDTIASGLGTGSHVVSVRAQDSAGNWSATANITLLVDNVGPTTSNLSLSPNPSSGAVSVNLSFRADDSASGNSNITAAEYFIDPVGTPAPGTGTAVTIGSPAPVKTLNATIASGLSAGSHVISVRSRDAVNNWGALASIDLVVDAVGPAVTGVSAVPNPNNGALGFNTSVQAVRIYANFSDVSSGGSNITNAEGFLEAPGATGTGFVMIANDGNFNSQAEGGYYDLPLVVVGPLSNGPHPICVHAKDSAGNWGAFDCSYSLVIERTPPTILSINRVDATPTSAASVNFLVTFSESVTGVTSGNFSLVQGSGLTGAAITSVTGTGATRTVTASTGSGGGTLGLNLTSATGITDIAGNALPTTGLPFVGQVYTVQTPPLYFSTFGNTNPPGVGGTADDADIYFWDGSAFSRSIDVSAITNPLPGPANVDGFDRVDATHFYLSFNGNGTIPGIPVVVSDEDIVFYNAGTWSLYFDGSLYGLGGTTGSTSFDLDAISIVGGTLYFSTDNNNIPTGAGGTGDDADIYRWNGGSSYTRVVDASTIGIPSTGGGNANTDGFVWVDATHFYMSFANDTTAITGFGTVQDEDVVYCNAGSWSVYFDGTPKGLTGGNLDVDAFDLP